MYHGNLPRLLRPNFEGCSICAASISFPINDGHPCWNVQSCNLKILLWLGSYFFPVYKQILKFSLKSFLFVFLIGILLVICNIKVINTKWNSLKEIYQFVLFLLLQTLLLNSSWKEKDYIQFQRFLENKHQWSITRCKISTRIATNKSTYSHVI